MGSTKISWTDCVANPFPGCRKVSPGCDNCYAERMARRLKAMGHPAYQDVVDDHGWTGKVGCNLDAMKVPGKGKMVFCQSMGDLAYTEIPFADFCAVVGHIMLQPWHTFQVLTKRPHDLAKTIDEIIEHGTKARYLDPLMLLSDAVSAHFTAGEFAAANEWYKAHCDQSGRGTCDLPVRWPLQNLWAGATCESQEWLDKRAQEIVDARAVVHFFSFEPLLTPIKVTWPKSGKLKGGFFAQRESLQIDWTIIGSESGPGRRECKLEWVQDIIDQCHGAGVPVFVKQLSVSGEIVHDAEAVAELLGRPVEAIRQMPGEGEK